MQRLTNIRSFISLNIPSILLNVKRAFLKQYGMSSEGQIMVAFHSNIQSDLFSPKNFLNSDKRNVMIILFHFDKTFAFLKLNFMLEKINFVINNSRLDITNLSISESIT